MALNGYVKLHRRLLEWEWYDDMPVKSVFLDLLLRATHYEREWRGIRLKPGQVPTSTIGISRSTGLSEQQVKTALRKLIKTGEISKESTNKYSIITIEKWGDYQIDEVETNQQITNNQPSSNHQSTINQPQLKNEKNEKKNIYSASCEEIVGYLNDKVGTQYRPNSKATVRLIKARLNDKFTVDDFKTVIDKKVAEWKGTEFEKFLKPDTLFGSKFEGYLNQTGTRNQPKPKSNQMTIEPPRYPEFKPDPKVDTVQMPAEIRDRLREMF